MLRHHFVRAGFSAALSFAVPCCAGAAGLLDGDAPIGKDEILIAEDGPDGRILVTDSAVYRNELLKNTDVLIAASYAGIGTFVFPFRHAVKAVICHDAGVGKDQAGISGLPAAEKYGIPAASIAAMSAELSNGRSAAHGVISFANAPAAALGVRPGQAVYDAAMLLLKAAPGKVVNLESAMDNGVYQVDKTASGVVWASTSSYAIKGTLPNDVVCIGSNTARVFAESIFPIGPRGAIANDAGLAKNDSGVGALPMLQKAGIAGAAVAAASARIGDGMSTWRDGIISRANDLATSRGVRAGMSAKDAARAMLS